MSKKAIFLIFSVYNYTNPGIKEKKVMETSILYGVGKKVRNAYKNGKCSESEVISIYSRNLKEANAFSVFGYKTRELAEISKSTHNPLLKARLEEIIMSKKNLSKKSNEQNDLSLQKLEMFKKNALGVGLRKVLSHLKNNARKSKNLELHLVLMLLETEFANLSAKQNRGNKKGMIYERKAYLLYRMSEYLDIAGWKYGINEATGKNAAYIVYVYLPNGVQLSWHTNDYDMYQYYPLIDSEWDGQACMTMEKILNYVQQAKLYS